MEPTDPFGGLRGEVTEELVTKQGNVYKRGIQPVDEATVLIAGTQRLMIGIGGEKRRTRHIEHLEVCELELHIGELKSGVEQAGQLPAPLLEIYHHVAVPDISVDKRWRTGVTEHRSGEIYRFVYSN